MMVLKTKTKIALARIAYNIIMGFRQFIGLNSVVIVKRRGITWKLDLSEGIDFAIYLGGIYELKTIRAYRKLVKSGYAVVDIGSNIGVHTLYLAKCVGTMGRVISIEPTDFAFRKLKTNVSLNPGLAQNISIIQAMLVADKNKNVKTSLYSSWPLNRHDGEVHPIHGGRLKEAHNAQRATLDDIIQQIGVKNIDFIKIDVDGNECDVFKGAINTLRKYRPKIVMELAPYVFDETDASLEELLSILDILKYRILNQHLNKVLPSDADYLRSIIPVGSGINVIAYPVDE